MLTVYLILVGVCLVALAIRTGYELFKKAGKVDPHNKVIFAVVFVAMIVMLLSWPLLSPLDPLHLNVPAFVQWLGLAALAVGSYLAVGGLLSLRGVENIDHLVTGGLYARLRHPMYTGFVLWIAGWVLFHGAAASLMPGIICIANIIYWSRLEDAKLASQFGDAYHQYRMHTWF
jgi:protein-S-isoprenylcysteine O-methyltransferase Ste14